MKVLGLDIEMLGHDGVKIKHDKTIYIDPFQLKGNPEKADLVLITHEHYDHCSPKDLELITKPETIIITVADCQSKLSSLKFARSILVEPGKSVDVLGYNVTAVRAYNVNKQFHPKANDWVGYVIDVGGKRVYHAGDTDLIPEMREIDVDIAFLPVSGTYVMTAEEAAKATAMFKRCKVAIPMHYGAIVGSASDAERFREHSKCQAMVLM